MNLKEKLAKPLNPYTQPNASPGGTRKTAGVRKAHCETKSHQKK